MIALAAFNLVPAYAAMPAPPPSVAFYYGNDVPVHMLNQFDWTVIEAAQVDSGQLETLQRHGTAVFAYVSAGEAERWRGDDPAIPTQTLKADNEHWNSRAADLTRSEWGDYLVDERIRPLWQAGYRGVFLDTLDSYRLFTRDEAAVAAQQAALVALIKRIGNEFPDIKLLLNRGFEILDQVHDEIVGMAAESLYKSWDPATDSYRDVSASDRKYVRGQLERVRDDYGLPAIAIDYLPPAKRAEARATARRIADDGLIPWVTSPTLDQVGVGLIEAVPRKVLVLYDGSTEEHGGFANTSAHHYIAMPLEYLGFGAVYQDVDAPLPGDTLTGRYAGIVSWFDAPIGDSGTDRDWLTQQIDDGVRVAIFGDAGLDISGKLARQLGVRPAPRLGGDDLTIVEHDGLIGFEGMPERLPARQTGFETGAQGVVEHLVIGDGDGARFAPVISGEWGGVALSPWVLQQVSAQQSRWILDPFAFLTRALDLPVVPMPDATTENGSRY